MSRTRLDMFAEVLETAKSGASKTRILTQANLDYKHATSSLDVLTDLGLLTRRQNSPMLNLFLIQSSSPSEKPPISNF